jgi:hypothetical protein
VAPNAKERNTISSRINSICRLINAYKTKIFDFGGKARVSEEWFGVIAEKIIVPQINFPFEGDKGGDLNVNGSKTLLLFYCTTKAKSHYLIIAVETLEDPKVSNEVLKPLSDSYLEEEIYPDKF